MNFNLDNTPPNLSLEKNKIVNKFECKNGDMLDLDKTTIFLLKPDATGNNELQNEILKRLSYFVDIKKVKNIDNVDGSIVREHYEESSGRFYFPTMTKYLEGKNIIALIGVSKNVIERAVEKESVKNKFDLQKNDFHSILRKLVIGPSKVIDTQKQHIRGLGNKHGVSPEKYLDESDLSESEVIDGWRFCEDNLIHCSDSPKSTLREIKLWFPEI